MHKMKIALSLCMLCALGCAQAQLNTPSSATAGMPSGKFFQNVVLQSEAQKLLIRPNLPQDLRQRVLDVMTNAEQGFNNCSTATTTMAWMHMRCNALQLKMSKNELKAIESEAKARAQAASMAALLQSSTKPWATAAPIA